jgi:hypothetical protein
MALVREWATETVKDLEMELETASVMGLETAMALVREWATETVKDLVMGLELQKVLKSM